MTTYLTLLMRRDKIVYVVKMMGFLAGMDGSTMTWIVLCLVSPYPHPSHAIIESIGIGRKQT